MFIDRDAKGNITGRYAAQQQPGQEEIKDDSPELLLIAGKATALAAIDTAADAASAAGFAWNGTTYQIDDQSRQNIAAWGSIALGVMANVPGLTWPQGFVWVAADNSRVPFGAADFLTFAMAAANHATALVLNGRGLKDAVAAATTAQALAAVDPSKGW
jgi:Domain of unknown function (DUF4376)